MSDGQVRLATILLVVLLALTAVVRFWEAPETADTLATAVVWTFQAEKVERIEITRRDSGTMILVRDGELWRIEQPIQAKVEPYLMRQVLEDLAALEKGVPMGEGAPGAFGLDDPPRIRVRAMGADGSARELWFGDLAPVGEQVYARSVGGPVVAVDTRVTDVLAAPAENWRDRRILDFGPSEVRRVSIASAEGTLELRREGDRWWSQGFTRADADKVEDLLLGLLDLRFDEFTSGAAPVESPTHTVTVEEGDGTLHRFRIAAPDTMGSVRLDVDSGPSGSIAIEPLALLRQGPTDVGDRDAFVLDETAARQIEVKLGSQQVTLTRSGETWSRDGQSDPRASALIEAIRRAPIDYRREPVAPIAEEYGFIAVTDAVGEHRVLIGQPDGEAHRVARDSAGGEPYRVPISALLEIAGQL
jgi:hypothetical protein